MTIVLTEFLSAHVITDSHPKYLSDEMESIQRRASKTVRGLGARGPEFDSRISHPFFDFFPFLVTK